MATDAVRRTAARIGALARWSKDDPVEGTRAARESFLARFERQVDPEGVLDPDERQRRALCARRAYMSQLALRSAKSRAVAA